MKWKVLVIGLILAAGGFYVYNVGATPPDFLVKRSADATTTVTYMTPGTATSTITFDSFNDNPSGVGVDSAELDIIFHASSAAAVPSTLTWRIEYSQDGNTWYQHTDAQIASTTQWAWATSTIDEWSNDIYQLRSYPIATPERYVRVHIGCLIGGKNCAVWSQIIAKKQLSR